MLPPACSTPLPVKDTFTDWSQILNLLNALSFLTRNELSVYAIQEFVCLYLGAFLISITLAGHWNPE